MWRWTPLHQAGSLRAQRIQPAQTGSPPGAGWPLSPVLGQTRATAPERLPQLRLPLSLLAPAGGCTAAAVDDDDDDDDDGVAVAPPAASFAAVVRWFRSQLHADDDLAWELCYL